MKKFLISLALGAVLLASVAANARVANWQLVGSAKTDGEYAFTHYQSEQEDTWIVDFIGTFNFVPALAPVFQYKADQFNLVINTSGVALKDRQTDGSYINGIGQWGIVDKDGWNCPIWGSASNAVYPKDWGFPCDLISDGLIHWATSNNTPQSGVTLYQLRFEVIPNGGIGYNLYADAPAAVPEPGTILAALSILGPAGLMFRRRKA